MRQLFFCSFFFSLITLSGFSQGIDTVFVDEIDTVRLENKPVVIKSYVYQKIKKNKSDRSFSLLLDAGILKDVNYYDVCATCKENFNIYKKATTTAITEQYRAKITYRFKKLQVGLDISYRTSAKKIDYFKNVDTTLKNNIHFTYLTLGPTVGYKIFQAKKWNIDFFASLLYSKTLSQSGMTLGGAQINEPTNLSTKPLYRDYNILYHLSPTFSYKINDALLVVLSGQYYFDNFSTLAKREGYIEQRNSIGASLGIQYFVF